MRRISRKLCRRSLTTFRFWPWGLWSHWDMLGNLSTEPWTSQTDAGYFTSVKQRKEEWKKETEEQTVRMLPRKLNRKTSTIRPKEQTNRKVEILEQLCFKPITSLFCLNEKLFMYTINDNIKRAWVNFSYLSLISFMTLRKLFNLSKS